MSPITTAINNRQLLEFHYDGHARTVIPFAYGSHVTTRNMVMRALQVAGSSSSGKFDFPKLFETDKMTGLRVLDKTFEVPERYGKGDEHISPIICEL